MKKTVFTLIAFIIATIAFTQEQKVISDCTIMYAVVSSNGGQQSGIGSKIIYIKGKAMRIDLASNTFNQTVFYDDNTGGATVLKVMGESKYISSYNIAEWKKENSRYEGMAVSFSGNTRQILGYNCKQAIITLKNGNTYTVYYIPGLTTSVMESPFERKNIPGIVLEYESVVNQNEKILYTAKNIDFSPVPSYKFDIPKSGYRVLH